MKKMTFFACAAILTSAVAFTSCNKNDQNEPHQQSNEVVKTEFSIALPAQLGGGNGARRMPGATVQVSGRSQFQGMTNIRLVPFAKQEDIAAGDTRLGNQNIVLSDIANADALGTNSNAKVYPSVNIPLTTATMLFYAKSAATGTDSQIGSLTANNLDDAHGDVNDISFSLEPIVDAIGTPTGSGTSGEALIAYLNSIANAQDGSSIAWKNYTATESAAMTAMFETFSSWHSLSSYAVARGLSDLYNSLAPLAATSTLAANINTAIANATYATVSGSAPNCVVALKNSPLDLTNFPEEYGLPEGAVRIKYNTTAKEFQACTTADYETADNAPLDLYTYPAQLWYFANSQLKTSNSSKQAMYDNSNNWAAILAAHTDATAVNTRTRAVAVEDAIQYAVARLDVIVKLSGTTLNDNTPVTPKSVSCSDYPLTAVLIGGQKNVGFDFKPAGSTVYTIYDNVITGGSISATTSNTAANSTLVLESEVGADKDVNIAIELVNESGSDFIGKDGAVIPAGGKFYLAAVLKANVGEGTEKTTDVTPNQVFKQDYTTTATLTITSLRNAQNTIPDLRTPQLELGVSVDLNWTSGNVYEINL